MDTGGDELYLKITIINLDDEPPTFTPGPCSMEVFLLLSKTKFNFNIYKMFF